ncbi:MAG: SDR family oxidoreductase [Solirubrobacterales bacterium]
MIVDVAADSRLDGKVAWVTGASRGLGRGIAKALAAAGAEVVLSARSGAELAAVEAEIGEAGGVAHVVVGSITDADSREEAVSLVANGPGRLDVLVNNAGISPHFGRSEDLDEAVLLEVLETNLVAPFACCRAAFPLLVAAGDASVVNVSSVHGAHAFPRLLAYATSKGGLEIMTRTLALEWIEHGVRVNSLAPGYIATDMTEGLRRNDRLRTAILDRTPAGRFADVGEIVRCAVFLASPASSFVTGSTLFADGGWGAR